AAPAAEEESSLFTVEYLKGIGDILDTTTDVDVVHEQITHLEEYATLVREFAQHSRRKNLTRAERRLLHESRDLLARARELAVSLSGESNGFPAGRVQSSSLQKGQGYDSSIPISRLKIIPAWSFPQERYLPQLNELVRYFAEHLPQSLNLVVEVAPAVSLASLGSRFGIVYEYVSADEASGSLVLPRQMARKEETMVLVVTDADVVVRCGRTNEPESHFGYAYAAAGAAFTSPFRLGFDFARNFKNALHEIGHLLGLGHCNRETCVMYFSEEPENLDITKTEFCPRCRVALDAEAAGSFREISPEGQANSAIDQKTKRRSPCTVSKVSESPNTFRQRAVSWSRLYFPIGNPALISSCCTTEASSAGIAGAAGRNSAISLRG
ncbi:MAG: hypothetical protein PHD09_07975, partial [Candidatus Omnitrophica bacterium]|nr:hypothetical protein [Candidatus Omnitrophota bacterium]